MKGNADIIRWLNRQLQHEYEESIEEMKHVDLLIGRILFMEGLPIFRSWAN